MSGGEKTHAIGIDNGQKGAIAMCRFSDNALWYVTTPSGNGRLWRRTKHIGKDNAGKDYRPSAMLDVVRQLIKTAGGSDRVVVAIEMPLANTSAASTRGTSQDTFRGLGIWEAVLDLVGVTPFGVHPSSWKSAMGLLKKPKEYALEAALLMFPDTSFDTIDQAEAAMMAKYAERYLS